MVALKNLISHRFRGFSEYENTIEGLKAALDFGVLNLEFDIRVAKCGSPMIYHDEYARDANEHAHFLCDVMAKDFASLGGTFGRIPKVETLFDIAADHKNKARLLVDIKDGGFEQEILALIYLNRLQNRTVCVSWLPEVLYNMHAIAPDMPLCLSHWCQKPGMAIRAKHKVYEARDGHIPRKAAEYVHGKRTGWYVKDGLKGDLRKLIKQTKGSVCVPQNMVTRDIVDAYHADNIDVSTFSYTDWPKIVSHKDSFNIDLYFIDNKQVFDEL